MQLDADHAFDIPHDAVRDSQAFTVEIVFTCEDDAQMRYLQLLSQRTPTTGWSLSARNWGVIGSPFELGVNDGTMKIGSFKTAAGQKHTVIVTARRGMVVVYWNGKVMKRFFTRIIPNLEPIRVGPLRPDDGKNKCREMKGVKLHSLRFWGPDEEYYAAGESKEFAEGYRGGPGWLMSCPAEDEGKKLPRILCYGDSILAGYGPVLRKLLEGQAYVYIWSGFVGSPEGRALNRKPFLEACKVARFDAVIFNNGLHSLHWTEDKVSDELLKDTQDSIFRAFQEGAPNAKIWWLSTTPHTSRTKNAQGKVFEVGNLDPIVCRINRLTSDLMTANDVAQIDAYRLLRSHLDLACGDEYHWTATGYKMMAEEIRRVVMPALEDCAEVKNSPPSDRPSPSPALAKRLVEGVERYGIVHFSINTFTDREWGYGNEDPTLFAPTAFDADQIVRSCKAGGLQGLIVVAKHHDGFCLWPTKTTRHSIAASPFRQGRGDYVKEMQEACERHGLKFGVYVSPWDRNHAMYATPAYREVFRQQVLELFSGKYGRPFELWFDGANGGDGWYGGACETRKIPKNYYRFQDVIDEVRTTNPDVCVFYDWDEGDLHYPMNESGDLDPDCRASFPTRAQTPTPGWERCLYKGDINGALFKQPECDFPLRPGWFYHREHDGKTRSPEFLMKIYLRTCGNGGSMNVGIAPDRRGVLTDEDTAALTGFERIRSEYFSRPSLPEQGFNVIVMAEDVSYGERVDGWEFVLDGRVLTAGQSIGIKRIRVLDRLEKGMKTELRVNKSCGKPGEVRYELYSVNSDLLKRVAVAKEPELISASFENVGTPTAKSGRFQTFMFKHQRVFSAIVLTPDKASLAGAPVEFLLAFSDDGQTWRKRQSTYRLDNIAANPIPQTIDIGSQERARYIRVEAKRLLDDDVRLSNIGLSVLTK